jgi:glycosyltransferase involved in cell wall biosynthesis
MLNSIEQITYLNLEIIISDDNSTDESINLIKSRQLPNCKIFTHSRYGLVNNWNYCIKQAKGKYIKFLFQDDTIKPDCISKMVEIAEQDEQVGLVFCDRNLISEQTLNPKHFPEKLYQGWSSLQHIQWGINFWEDVNLMKHPHNKIGEPTAVLIRKEVFDKVGLFDSSFKQYVDLEMWLRIMTRYKIAFINEKLASFRIHPRQATQTNLAEDISWSEIYYVWLKLLYDPIYQVIPSQIRQRIKITLIKQLIREYIKSIILGKTYRWGKISELLIKS